MKPEVTALMSEIKSQELKWAIAFAWTMEGIRHYPKKNQGPMIDAMGLLLEFRSGRKVPEWVMEERKKDK
jgi:hypothetical protein